MSRLMEKRADIKTRHKLLHEVQGTPGGGMPLGDRPVMFVGDYDGIFAGECATFCLAALKGFYDREKDSPRELDPQWSRAMRLAKESAITTGPDGEPRLVINRMAVNDCFWALTECGIPVCSTGIPKEA